MVKTRFFIISLILFCSNGFAQSYLTAIKFPQKDFFIKNLAKVHSTQIRKYDKSEVLEEIYKWRREYITSLFEINAILYEDSLYSYLNFIFDHIIKSNPKLQTLEIRFLISNAPIPNALSLGDGTFIINLSLLRKLDNEAQLAFVLCHELAHFYLDHSNQTAINRFNLTNSENYKREIKSIKNNKYGRYESAKSMILKNKYSAMAHSRAQENEADSLGLILLKNTVYDLNQSISCMYLLDTIDHYKYQKRINYHRTLSFENYPFKKRWLDQGITIFGGQIESDYWDKDSIKSHPDCANRAILLRSQLPGVSLNSSNKYVQDSSYFAMIKEKSDYEFIESWIFYTNYSKALFYTLKQLESDPDNDFLVLKSSYILRLIYQSHIDHEFSKYVDRPSFDNENEYNQFLYFLDNIRVSELANLCYHYYLGHIERLQNDKQFMAGYIFFKTLIGS